MNVSVIPAFAANINPSLAQSSVIVTSLQRLVNRSAALHLNKNCLISSQVRAARRALGLAVTRWEEVVFLVRSVR